MPSGGNPNHDEKGRFASGPGGGGAAGKPPWTGKSVGVAHLKKEERDLLAPHENREYAKVRDEAVELNAKGRAGKPVDRQRARDLKKKLLEIRAVARERLKARGEPLKLPRDKIGQLRDALKQAIPPASPPSEMRAPAAKVERMPSAPTPEASTEGLRKLQETPVKSKKKLGGGVNGSYKVTLADGSVGVWKPRSEEARGMRANVPNRTSYRREAAAYDVAKAIGLEDLVPPTVQRTIAGEKGSLQEFVKDAVTAHKTMNRYDGARDLMRAIAFDCLIGNTDRHSGNWMIQGGNKLWLIDHGLAFPTYKKDLSGDTRCWLINGTDKKRQFGPNPRVPEEVQRWDGDKIKAALERNGIEHAAVQQTLVRLAKLKKAASRMQYIQDAFNVVTH